jgi:TPR repeat protein
MRARVRVCAVHTECCRAGELFLGGKAGFEKDVNRAIDYFQRAGDLGERSGFAKLGKMHMLGLGVPIDMKKAKEFYEKGKVLSNHLQFDKLAVDKHSVLEEEELANRGYEQSKFNMGIRNFFGIGIAQNKAKSLEYLTPQLCAKYPHACEFRFRVFFESNRMEDALSALQLGVELKNERCMFLLAKTYLEGVTVDKSLPQAMRLFHQAAMLGDPFAHTELASLLLKQAQQQSGTPAQQTEQLALFHLHHAAQYGDANAKARLAQYYLDRADATNDASLFEIAVKYLDEAEKEKSIDALNLRAHLLLKPRPQFNAAGDFNKSWLLRQRAADAGHADACYFYGCHLQKSEHTLHSLRSSCRGQNVCAQVSVESCISRSSQSPARFGDSLHHVRAAAH